MHFTKPDCCCGLERSQEVNLWSTRYTRTNTFPVKKSNGEWKTNTIFIISSCVWAYMCCLLCLQWAFSLNNFAGIDLVKLIPHTVYLVKCVCVCVCVLRIRPPLSVHGAATLCRNEVKRCLFALQNSSWTWYVGLGCIWRQRESESEIERERERERARYKTIFPIRHIEPSA